MHGFAHNCGIPDMPACALGSVHITPINSDGARLGSVRRSLAARLSARVSELVLSEQQARMARSVPEQAQPASSSIDDLQERVRALEAEVANKDQVWNLLHVAGLRECPAHTFALVARQSVASCKQ